MASDSTGLRITPLTLAVAGALWGVLFALMAWNLTMTVDMARSMNNIPSQVADHEQRIRVLEKRP